jgi:small subunit ribosomal protein S6
MRAYELMVIVDGSLEDGPAQQWVSTVSKAIAAAGGSVHGKVDWWGKRRLAYPINKREEGYYMVLDVTAPGGARDDFERTLRISDDILRHKLLRLPEAEAARRGLSAA